MLYLDNSISLCKSVEQPHANMANPSCSPSPHFVSKSRRTNNIMCNRKMATCLKIPPCHCSPSPFAVLDVVIFIAVVCACGFLLFPYFHILMITCIEIGGAVVDAVKQDFAVPPFIYVSIGLTLSSALLATFVVVTCTGRKCGNANCKGLKNSVEFDIQLETEDCVKNCSGSGSLGGDGDGVKKGLFELGGHQNRELEAQLRKMAPPNGRAVLILRAKCGCSVGTLQVPAPKKHRNIRK